MQGMADRMGFGVETERPEVAKTMNPGQETIPTYRVSQAAPYLVQVVKRSRDFGVEDPAAPKSILLRFSAKPGVAESSIPTLR